MTDVAKVLVVDANDHYLIMTRSNHPTFGFDPDLPGGTIEPGEVVTEGAARELYEEIGLEVAAEHLELMYRDSTYAAAGTAYDLYQYRVNERPDVTISWEHSEYEWVSRDECIRRAHSAVDGYMHMVRDALLAA